MKLKLSLLALSAITLIHAQTNPPQPPVMLIPLGMWYSCGQPQNQTPVLQQLLGCNIALNQSGLTPGMEPDQLLLRATMPDTIGFWWRLTTTDRQGVNHVWAGMTLRNDDPAHGMPYTNMMVPAGWPAVVSIEVMELQGNGVVTNPVVSMPYFQEYVKGVTQ